LNLVQEILYELLEATAPKTLLCVSAEGVVSSVDQYVAHNADCALTTMAPAEATDLLAEQGRFDYAVLSGALEDVPHDDGAALIARLRASRSPAGMPTRIIARAPGRKRNCWPWH
jgi:hypothetical protein